MPQNNHAAPLPPWRPGQPLMRARINTLVDQANQLATITGGRGVNVTRTNQGVVIALEDSDAPIASGEVFLARITSSSSSEHAWTELQSSTAGAFTTLVGGRTGSTSENPAYEVNGRQGVPAGTIVWMMARPASDGTLRYTFDLGAGEPGSAASMTYTGQHVEAASTSTWAINNQSTTRGLSITVQTGQRYDASATTPILYAYLRTLTFDANGHLTAVSAESRVVIDTPEECT